MDRAFSCRPRTCDALQGSTSRHVLVQCAATAVCACLIAACVTSHTPQLLAFPDPALRPTTNLDHIDSYQTAAATVLAVIEQQLGFESFPLAFQFCADGAAFEATLLKAGYDRALARDTSQTMQAVGGYRRIVINEAALSQQPWPSRVAMLAHEVGHSLQYEWGAGQRGTSDQWLREGFAEWLSVQVLDRLGGIRESVARRHYMEVLRQNTPSAARAPKIEEMVTFRQWVSLGQNPNSTQYAQAFLSVELLVERYGLASIVTYFRSFAHSSDRAANFRNAFGEDLASFASAANARLWPRRR